MKRIKYVLIVLGVLCLPACKETPTPPRVEPVPPSLPPATSLKVNLPVNAHTQVRDFVDEIYRSLNNFYRISEQVKQNEPLNYRSLWTWTSASPFGTITLEAAVLAGDSSRWKLYYNTINANNWISAEGKVTADGKYGAWKFYQSNSTTLNKNLIGLKTAQGVLTIDASHFYDASQIDDTPSTYIVSQLIGRPDNSGSLEAFDHDVKVFEAEWDATGAGSWAAYNQITGRRTEGGSWE